MGSKPRAPKPPPIPTPTPDTISTNVTSQKQAPVKANIEGTQSMYDSAELLKDPTKKNKMGGVSLWG